MSRRILLAVTADVSLAFVEGVAVHLAGEGWDVHVATSPGPRLKALGATPGVTCHPLRMSREPSPSDLRSLLDAYRLLRRVRPDVVSAGTPKAGLLVSLAGTLARVPVRVYQLWGLRYETTAGPARRVFMAMEWLACRSATVVLGNSRSLVDEAVGAGIVGAGRIRVLGPGSSHGVDLDRFAVDPATRESRQRARWDDDAAVPVVGYIGRLNPDKGIDTLVEAVRLLAARGVAGRLVLVGGADGVDEALLRSVEECGWPTELWGQVEDVSEPLAHMDVLCLPTRREGFPNVVLEASVAGIPTVATRATGVVDAVVHGTTGLVTETYSAVELADQLVRVLEDPELRRRLGSAARDRVSAEFDQRDVWRRYADFYAAQVTR